MRIDDAIRWLDFCLCLRVCTCVYAWVGSFGDGGATGAGDYDNHAFEAYDIMDYVGLK